MPLPIEVFSIGVSFRNKPQERNIGCRYSFLDADLFLVRAGFYFHYFVWITSKDDVADRVGCHFVPAVRHALWDYCDIAWLNFL